MRLTLLVNHPRLVRRPAGRRGELGAREPLDGPDDEHDAASAYVTIKTLGALSVR